MKVEVKIKKAQVETFADVIERLKELKAKRVFVHFPEGIKVKIQKIADDLENEGFEVALCLERTYGGCDVREDEAKRLKCDAIVHIAHEDFGVKTELPVVYWDYFLEVDALPILEKEFHKLEKFENIGLVTSLQFVQTLPKVAEFLESRGKKVFLHKSLQFAGQMLGCRIGAGLAVDSKVDAFLCISAGKFYSLGLVMYTKKPVLNLDLETNSIYELAEFKKKILKIKEWNKAQFKEAKNIGLLVSWKKGQMFSNPFKVKSFLERQDKKVYLLAMDEISEEKIEGLKIDFLINFACPRLGVEDISRFKRPTLNWFDLKSI